MLVVMALDGATLVEPGRRNGVAGRRLAVQRAARVVVEVATEHHVVLTYGRGPQAGLLALQALTCAEVAAYPLEVPGAETEDTAGHLLEQELGRLLPADRLATLMTRVVVDPDDAAFAYPTEPVGPLYDSIGAERLAHRPGWSVARAGVGWRRVVPSPLPRSIIELPTLRILVDRGVTVICPGGGGIPVLATPPGPPRSVEAVVDPYLAAARLAIDLDADALLLLTDLDVVHPDAGTGQARPLRDTTVDELRTLTPSDPSLAARIEAICSFVEHGGWLGAIGSLPSAAAILRGEAGTRVRGADDTVGASATAGSRVLATEPARQRAFRPERPARVAASEPARRG
jgi:carbamate kinase